MAGGVRERGPHLGHLRAVVHLERALLAEQPILLGLRLVERAHLVAQLRHIPLEQRDLLLQLLQRRRRLLLVGAQPYRRRELLVERAQLGFEQLLLLLLVLGDLADVVDRLRELRRREDVVELLLQRRVVAERPARLLLVNEDDRLEHGGRDAHHVGEQLVQVGAAVGEGLDIAVVVARLEHLLELLVLLLLLLLDQREIARAHDRLADERVELELDLRLDLRGLVEVGVVDERLPALAPRRQVARACHLQALDDRRLPRAVLADDQRERPVELDDLRRVGREGADPADRQLLHARHAAATPAASAPLTLLARA